MDMTLQDIRDNIDTIDFKIMDLLKKRQELVVSAAKFKTQKEGENGVIVPSRIHSMLKERVEEAQRLGLDVEFVDKLFNLIIEHMIELEMERWLEYDKSTK